MLWAGCRMLRVLHCVCDRVCTFMCVMCDVRTLMGKRSSLEVWRLGLEPRFNCRVKRFCFCKKTSSAAASYKPSFLALAPLCSHCWKPTHSLQAFARVRRLHSVRLPFSCGCGCHWKQLCSLLHPHVNCPASCCAASLRLQFDLHLLHLLQWPQQQG